MIVPASGLGPPDALPADGAVDIVKTLRRRMAGVIDGIMREDEALNAVLLDASPFYRARDIERELWQAAICWQRSTAISSTGQAVLRAYHELVAANLEIELGVFHHPLLNWVGSATGVRPPQGLRLTHAPDHPDTKSAESVAYQSLRDELLSRHRAVVSNVSVVVEAFTTSECFGTSTFRLFADLGHVTRLEAFTLARRLRLERLANDEDRALAQDFELIHEVYHTRLREMAGWGSHLTTLVAMPFDVSLSQPMDLPTLVELTRALPDDFLGAMWLVLVHRAQPVLDRRVIEREVEAITAAVTMELLPVFARNRMRAGHRQGLESALSAFAHQIRETATGIGSGWLMRPEEWEHTAALYRDGPYQERLETYRIAPAPDLYSRVGATLALWAQSRRWQDLFFDHKEPPSTLRELIEIAFDYAKDIRFVARFRNDTLQHPQQMLRIWEAEALDFLRKETHLVFDRSPECLVPERILLKQEPPSARERAAFYADLCESLRLYVALFDNYMGRGDTSEPVRIKIVGVESAGAGLELRVAVHNWRNDSHWDDQSNVKPGMRGREVIDDLVQRLGGRITRPASDDESKTFEVTLILAADPLWRTVSGKDPLP